MAVETVVEEAQVTRQALHQAREIMEDFPLAMVMAEMVGVEGAPAPLAVTPVNSTTSLGLEVMAK